MSVVVRSLCKQRRVSVVAGFTMIELVTAMAIVGLLIVVVIASIYDHQSHKAKRKAAHRLQEVAEWMHMQHAHLNSYAAILPADWSDRDAEAGYTITVARQPVEASDPAARFPAVGADAFTLQAAFAEGDACGSLLLDQSGRRGVTGAGARVADCWD